MIQQRKKISLEAFDSLFYSFSNAFSLDKTLKGYDPIAVDGSDIYVDEMYGQYVKGAAEVTKAAAQTQTENGTATETTGTSKATPGFDVMDYGQENYEFGSSTQDARHFDKYVLKVLQEDAETLSELFNSEEK